jgi:hypothetical protein
MGVKVPLEKPELHSGEFLTYTIAWTLS